jgi:predicted nucleic acid-binding Zn ribbon protein
MAQPTKSLEHKTCKYCGKELPIDAMFCSECGKKQE